MKILVEFALAYESMQPTDVLYALDKCGPCIGLSVDDYSQPHEVQKIERGGDLELTGRVLTNIDGGSIANHMHDALFIEVSDLSVEKVERLVECLMSELEVLQAFVHDENYNRWQNAEDLLLYDAHGVDHAALTKVSNGLPFPLTAEVVDISRNPGRFYLRDGYRESIASPMWIRTQLVVYPEALQRIDGLRVEKVAEMLKIQSVHCPFNSDLGDQRRLQEEMRRAVYGT